MGEPLVLVRGRTAVGVTLPLGEPLAESQGRWLPLLRRLTEFAIGARGTWLIERSPDPDAPIALRSVGIRALACRRKFGIFGSRPWVAHWQFTPNEIHEVIDGIGFWDTEILFAVLGPEAGFRACTIGTDRPRARFWVHSEGAEVIWFESILRQWIWENPAVGLDVALDTCRRLLWPMDFVEREGAAFPESFDPGS